MQWIGNILQIGESDMKPGSMFMNLHYSRSDKTRIRMQFNWNRYLYGTDFFFYCPINGNVSHIPFVTALPASLSSVIRIHPTNPTLYSNYLRKQPLF